MSATETLSRQIGELEKEVMEKQAKLSEMRRELPPEPVSDYTLKGEGGREVRLSELFGDKTDLIVIHNMGSSCPYCTLWADGFNGLLPHFENRAAFALVSPDDPEAQRKFAEKRGWRFPMLSAAESTFTQDMGYVKEHEGKTMWWPGFSTFRRNADGGVERIAHASFGPGDPYCGIWHMFALLDGGTGDWQPKFSYV